MLPASPATSSTLQSVLLGSVNFSQNVMQSTDRVGSSVRHLLANYNYILRLQSSPIQVCRLTSAAPAEFENDIDGCLHKNENDKKIDNRIFDYRLISILFPSC